MTLEEIVKNIAFPKVFDDFIGGVFIINLESKILYWSRGAEEIIGYTEQEALGKHCSFIEAGTCFPYPCKGDVGGCGLYKKGYIKDVHCTCKSKDGKQKHIIRNGIVIKDKFGKAIGGLESIVDITEMICAEKALLQLKKTIVGQNVYGKLVGKSRQMRDIYELIDEVADSTASVLISGESGTGKELIADALHFKSSRAEKPFVKVNCSALPETLLESELFGHVRGSFTGAVGDKEGRFEFADGGTLFLDEIGDVSPLVQVKLLRVLQEKSFERVGSNKTIKVDVRIIAATNKELALLVKEGKFREDLFYRLNVIPIKVPPLRERQDDIPLLVQSFMTKFSAATKKRIERIDEDALALLLDYNWPGNIRELANAIEHAFVRSKENIITIFSLPQHLRMFHFNEKPKTDIKAPHQHQEIKKGRHPTKEEIEQGLLEVKYNRGALAKKLGISRTTLWKLMK